MKEIVYEFKNVSKKTKSVELRDISFSIPMNKSVGFVIEDDDTRTLFSNLVCGFDSPDDGCICIHGKEAYFDGYPYDKLGVLLNEPSFINTHDGFKNLKFLSEINENVENIQIAKIMNYVGLDPLSEVKVCNYSYAMYRKLSLAYALIPGHNILIINDPFKYLTEYAFKDFMILYKKLRTDHTMIYISKSAKHLEELCDVIA